MSFPALAPRLQRSSLPDPERSVRVPARIDATGVAEAGAPLQRFIDRVPDRTRVVFPRGAVYRLDKGLVLDGRSGLVLDGNGAMLIGSGCGVEDSLFVIGRDDPASRIVIRDFTLIGGNADGGTVDAYDGTCEFQMGIVVYQSTQIEIDDVDIQRVFGDCVYLGGASKPLRWTETVWFHDSRCSLNGRMGIAVTAGRDVLVERVDFDSIGLFPFDIEPNNGREGATAVHFVDNAVGTYTHSDQYSPYVLKTNGAGDEGAVVKDVTFRGNVVTGGPLRVSIRDENRSGIVIAENSSTVEADGPVMYFSGVDGLLVVRNDQPLSGGSLVSVSDSTDVVVQ